QGNVSAAELARIHDAIGSLSASLGEFGVHLVEVPAGRVANAITISVSGGTAMGGESEGILGLYALGRPIVVVQDWNWYVGANPAGIQPGQFDFQSVVTHELGHALGFAHSADSGSVMYGELAAGQVRRTLTAGDLALIGQELLAAGPRSIPLVSMAPTAGGGARRPRAARR